MRSCPPVNSYLMCLHYSSDNSISSSDNFVANAVLHCLLKGQAGSEQLFCAPAPGL